MDNRVFISIKAPQSLKNRISEIVHRRKMNGNNQITITEVAIELLEKSLDIIEQETKLNK